MRKFKFALSTIWFYAVIVVGCLLSSNLGFLTSDPLGVMPANAYYLFTALFFVLLIAYFVIEHKKNRMPIDWILAPVCIGLMICNIIAIWHNPDVIQVTNPVNNAVGEMQIETVEKAKDTIFTVITYSLIYIVGFVFARGKVRPKKLIWLAIFGVLVNFVFCVATTWLDIDFYRTILNGAKGNGLDGCKSVYQNENVFGESLLAGIICAMVIIYHKPKWIWVWLFLIIEFVFVLFTTSTTCIIVATISLVLFCLLEIVFGFVQKHFVTTSFFAIGIFGLVFLAIMFLSVGMYSNFKPIVEINTFIKNEIFGKDFSSFTSRKNLWSHGLELASSNPFNLWFGFGMNISYDVFGTYESTYTPLAFTDFPHNGFIKILLDGGLITLIPYMLLIVYFMYCLIRLITKKRVKFSLFYLLFALTIILHDFFESSHFFKNYTISLLETILVLMPPIIAWKQYKHPELETSIKTSYAMPTQGVSSKHFVSMISLVISSLLIGCCSLFFGPSIYSETNIIKYVLIGIGFLGVSLLFVPYLSFLWYTKATDRRFVFRIIFNSILILGVSGLSIFLVYSKFSNSLKIVVPIGLGVYALCLFIDLVIYRLCRHGSFKTWLAETFKSIFYYNIGGLVVGVVLSFMITMITSLLLPLDLMCVIILAVFSFFVCLISYLVMPSSHKDEMLEDFNEECMLTLKRLLMEDKY